MHSAKMSAAASRNIVFRTRGHGHGPIVRLVSPSDVGELIKPFVFLDSVDVSADNAPGFGFHPHSGIATLTLLIDGGFDYEDSTGASGSMGQGSVEWMLSGGGVWHRGTATGRRIRGYQLWIALPPALENAPPRSQYLEPGEFGHHGPARVILGELGGVLSPIGLAASMNYLQVCLQAGQRWTYEPPVDHDVAWIALHEGRLLTPEPVDSGELAVFSRQAARITFEAISDAAFVLGSAPHHPYELAMGNYSVHTSPEALRIGEAGILSVAETLRRAGKL